MDFYIQNKTQRLLQILDGYEHLSIGDTKITKYFNHLLDGLFVAFEAIRSAVTTGSKLMPCLASLNDVCTRLMVGLMLPSSE
jgi:hypothetical protein